MCVFLFATLTYFFMAHHGSQVGFFLSYFTAASDSTTDYLNTSVFPHSNSWDYHQSSSFLCEQSSSHRLTDLWVDSPRVVCNKRGGSSAARHMTPIHTLGLVGEKKKYLGISVHNIGFILYGKVFHFERMRMLSFSDVLGKSSFEPRTNHLLH